MCKTGRDVENPDGGSNTGCCVLFLRLATTAAAAEAQRQPKPIRRPSPFLFLFHSPLITSNAFDSILVSPLSACPPEYLTALRCYCCCCCCRVLFLDWHSARVWRREMEGQTACGQNHHHRVPPPFVRHSFWFTLSVSYLFADGTKRKQNKGRPFPSHRTVFYARPTAVYIYYFSCCVLCWDKIQNVKQSLIKRNTAQAVHEIEQRNPESKEATSERR